MYAWRVFLLKKIYLHCFISEVKSFGQPNRNQVSVFNHISSNECLIDSKPKSKILNRKIKYHPNHPSTRCVVESFKSGSS